MNTFNTTYNFNQGNMNFGQALMYGAFGSLTGGMGCFGGGMGMMNPMGMGGSLFSMMGMGGLGYGCGGFGMSSFGMGGFGCGMSDSQYVGTLAGMMGSGLLIGGITKAIQNHKAAKAETQAKIDNAKSDVSTLTSEIKALEDENTELANPVSADGKVSSAATKACPPEAKAYTTAYSKLTSLKTETDLSKFNTEDIKAKIKERDALDKNDPKYATLDKQIKELQEAEKQRQITEWEKNEVIPAKNKLEAKIEEKIQENKDEIAAKTTKRDEAQQILDDIEEQKRVNFNNKNAKLEAQCDEYGKVDENNVIQEQTTNAGKFNQAYEVFKGNQSKANFNKLKTAYNELVENGNGNSTFSIKSFTNLMKHILKQHPDFDETNIKWG